MAEDSIKFKIGDQVEYIGSIEYIGSKLKGWDDYYPIYVRGVHGSEIDLTSLNPFGPYNANHSYSGMAASEWKIVGKYDPDYEDAFAIALIKWKEILGV